ncbi:MAG TPA: dihydrofolate reductase family protein [Anaerolineae bacterium]|nr:dihydrofolate reductase family protein [Anaerolineae bacterium]
MAKVMSGLSMSLDGFIAGPNDGPELPLGEGGERLFQWYADGDTEFVMPSGTMTVRVPAASAALMREVYGSIGALVSGRRTFDITNGWGGRHPVDVPVFVVTHRVPRDWANTDAPFTFVTDGVESAVEQARRAAGGKDVAVGAASITQQCLKAGLLDEVHIDLVPVLLGKGVRLFEHLGAEPIELERTRVVEAPGVTHVTFRVVK